MNPATLVLIILAAATAPAGAIPEVDRPVATPTDQPARPPTPNGRSPPAHRSWPQRRTVSTVPSTRPVPPAHDPVPSTPEQTHPSDPSARHPNDTPAGP